MREYYYFDARPGSEIHLRGWMMAGGQAQELAADEYGRLWSEELQSWVVDEGEWLRLYNADGRRRLTGEEAALEAYDAESEALEAERAARESAERALVELRRKLQERGIDPDTL